MAIMEKTGTQFFPTEEAMDTFLEDLHPGSTVVIKEWPNGGQSYVDEYQATWVFGKNITNSEYYTNGVSADDGDIYWYSHDKLWQLIPAFG